MFRETLNRLADEYESLQASNTSLQLENQRLRSGSGTKSTPQYLSEASCSQWTEHSNFTSKARASPKFESEGIRSEVADVATDMDDIILKESEITCQFGAQATDPTFEASEVMLTEMQESIVASRNDVHKEDQLLNRHLLDADIGVVTVDFCKEVLHERHTPACLDIDSDINAFYVGEQDITTKDTESLQTTPRHARHRPSIKSSAATSNASSVGSHPSSLETSGDPVLEHADGVSVTSIASNPSYDGLPQWLDPGCPRNFKDRHGTSKRLQFRLSTELEMNVSSPRRAESDVWTIDPMSKFRLIWDAHGCVCLFIEIWMTPLELVYLRAGDIPRFFEAVSHALTVFFGIDILLNFFTGYIKQGEKIMDRRAIVKTYVRFWLWLDLVATVPWDILLSIIGGNGISQLGKASKMWKILRYVKVLRAVRLLKTVHLAGNVARQVQQGSSLLKPLIRNLRLAQISMFIICGAHGHGIVWAALQSERAAARSIGGALNFYFASFWWALCAFCGGVVADANHQNPGIWVLEIIIALERVIFFVCVAKQILVDTLPTSTCTASRRMLDYLREHHVSVETQIKVLHSLKDTGQANQRETDINEFCKTSPDLPHTLQRQILVEMWSSRLKSLGLIERVATWAQGFLAELAQLAFEVIHPSRAILFQEGDAAIAASYIISGELRMLRSPELPPLSKYTQGNWIGENALISSALRYPASCMTCAVTSLMVVKGKDFLGLVSQLGLMEFFQEFCSEQLWRGFCGRCGSLGDHFSDTCPGALETAALGHVSLWRADSGTRIRNKTSDDAIQHVSTPRNIMGADLQQFLKKHDLMFLVPILQSHYGQVKSLDGLEEFVQTHLQELCSHLITCDDPRADHIRVRRTLAAEVFRSFREARNHEVRQAFFQGMSRLQHLIFLSHYKKEAGTEAALMRTEIEQAIRKDHGSLGHCFDEPVFLDSDNLQNLEDLQARVGNTHNLVLLLTEGVLTRPWVLVEIITARRHNTRVLPVSVSRVGSEFAFPDEAWFARLRDGSLLNVDAKEVLQKYGCPLTEVAEAVEATFQQIALTYSPHKSKAIRRAEIASLLRRCKLRGDMETPQNKVLAEEAQEVEDIRSRERVSLPRTSGKSRLVRRFSLSSGGSGSHAYAFEPASPR